MGLRINGRDISEVGIGSVLLLTVFMSVFFLAGLAGTGGMLFVGWERMNTYNWEAVPAQIIESRVQIDDDAGDNPYAFKVKYTYKYGGKTYTARTYQLDYDGSDSLSDTQGIQSRFPKGQKREAFVNPDAPSEAFLEWRGLGFLAFIFIPLIFMGVGAGFIFYTWRSYLRRKSGYEAPISSEAPSSGKRRWGPLGMAAFFSIFFFAGAGFGYMVVIRPAMNVMDAKDWIAVPCTIERSGIESHSDDDGTTYSLDMRYRYEYGGRTYRSDRYWFTTGSSSNYNARRAIVNAHPKGKQTTCYIDPDNPGQAVIDRGWPVDMWFGLIPLAFVLVGLGGMVGTGVYHFKKRTAQPHPKLVADQRPKQRYGNGMDRSRR